MALLDVLLKRRRWAGGSATVSHSYQPWAETLEDRQCPSVAAPTGLQLTAPSSTQVLLTWNDVAGETGFKVIQWNGTASVVVGQTAQHVTTFTVNNLQPNTIEWFAIEAFDATTTAQTAWASITTPATPITAPTNVAVSGITGTQATLTWSAATGQTGYHIYTWNGTSAVLVGTVGATVTTFKVQNLTPGITTYFYVQSFNATSYASSAWVSVATPTVSLTAPTNLKASALGSSTIQLSWTDSSGETGYKVYQWNGNEASTAVVVATLAANTTGYQAVGLLPGQTYWFYVQAFNTTSSSNSAWVDTATVPAAPLKGPTNFTGTATGPNTVNLSWTEPARAVGYDVFTWNGLSWTVVAQVAAGTHNVSIGALATGQTHWFLVEAFTTNNAETAFSSEIFVNL